MRQFDKKYSELYNLIYQKKNYKKSSNIKNLPKIDYKIKKFLIHRTDPYKIFKYFNLMF